MSVSATDSEGTDPCTPRGSITGPWLTLGACSKGTTVEIELRIGNVRSSPVVESRDA